MPLNPDDIRKRAEGVGWTIRHSARDLYLRRNGLIIARFYIDGAYGEEHQTLCHQAALDLIEAEERRQVCPECYGEKQLIDELINVHPWKATYKDCPDCKGTGEKVKEESDGTS